MAESEPKAKRARTIRNFPATTFSEALKFADNLMAFGSGQPIRRLTLLDEIGWSPTSSGARMAITNSSKYGLTKGSYTADFVELTDLGRKCVSDASTPRERARARMEAAIISIPPFNGVYEAFVESKLPAKSVLIDKIKEFDVGADAAEEAVDTFIVNLRDVGLLKTLSGAERIISVDMSLDELPSRAEQSKQANEPIVSKLHPSPFVRQAVITHGQAQFETTAFYVTPIGEDGSDQRKHTDLFSNSIVEPALQQSKLNLVRADRIDSPGIITRQILDYIINSRLVIADLSFHNPNVFYELAIRHLMRKPTVQIMRSRDKVPFDINQGRTIMIDDTDIYSLVPQIPVYVSTISAQVRQALESPDTVDNPISVYFPNLVASLQLNE